MAQEYRYRPGDRLDSWKLIEPLGAGGNAEVWEAEDPNGTRAAVKILRNKNPESEPYKRFRAEIEVLRSLGKRPGILPVIDASLPERPSQRNPAWLAMPIATPIAKALGEEPPLEKVVEAVADVAGTLIVLAAEHISHRDIKPENLYRYNDQWVIGDFGLVSFPDKEAITEDGRKLGPLHFLAPEMLTNPATAEGPAADVYSLIKTFWVLATGQRFPPPGQQTIEISQLTLSGYVEHERANLLDRLIENCTAYAPSSRPSMQEVATELRSWPHPAPALASSSDLSDLSGRIRASTGPRQKLDARNKKLIKEHQEFLRLTMHILEPLAKTIASTLGIGQLGFQQHGLFIRHMLQHRSNNQVDLEECPQNESVLNRQDVFIQARIPGHNETSLFSGIVSTLYRDGTICLEAAHLLRLRCPDQESCPPTMSWAQGMALELVGLTHKTSRLGSAHVEQVCTEIANELTMNLRPAIERFTVLLESGKGS